MKFIYNRIQQKLKKLPNATLMTFFFKILFFVADHIFKIICWMLIQSQIIVLNLLYCGNMRFYIRNHAKLN